MSKVPHARIIHTAAELSLLLQEIKSAVAQGALEQVYSTTLPFATNRTLISIPNEGPWPDYLEASFRVPGFEAQYKLAADTYHGVGGQWGLDEEDVKHKNPHVVFSKKARYGEDKPMVEEE